jgi:hypothetical protein
VNINLNQALALSLIILAALSGGTAQLADAGLAATTVKAIAGIAGLLSTIIAGMLSFLTGQGSIVQQVSKMTGVEPLKVNAQANPTLAALALDPTNEKIEVKPGAEAAVTKTAQQG